MFVGLVISYRMYNVSSVQKEISSLSCEPCPGSELVVSLFEVPYSPSSVAAFIAREHEFKFLAVQPYDLEGQTQTDRLAVGADASKHVLRHLLPRCCSMALCSLSSSTSQKPGHHKHVEPLRHAMLVDTVNDIPTNIIVSLDCRCCVP